ncbi:MAG: ABC transporter permease [Christensenellales bacterium]
MLLRLKRKYQPFWQLYLFLLLPLAYIILFAYVPMAGIQLAFKKFTILGGVWGSPWVGMAQFEKFIRSYYFNRVISNTLRLSIYSIIAGFPFPIVFALLLNTVTHMRFKKTVQTITYMPHFISVTVIVGIIMQVFHPSKGIYGIVMAAFNKKAVDLLASPGAFPHMYIWSGIWQGFGWGSIIYLAALTSVSPELHEAAAVDGASRLQRILHIDIPALVPTVAILLILRLGQIMNTGFEKIFLMQNDLNLRVSEVISTYVYKQGLGSGASSDYSYATAIGLFNSVINLLLISGVNFLARRCGEISLW